MSAIRPSEVCARLMWTPTLGSRHHIPKRGTGAREPDRQPALDADAGIRVGLLAAAELTL
jgi:hypothetical protein